MVHLELNIFNMYLIMSILKLLLNLQVKVMPNFVPPLSYMSYGQSVIIEQFNLMLFEVYVNLWM